MSSIGSVDTTRNPAAGGAVRAAAWNYAGTLVRSVSALTVGVLLARVLGPKPFGIVAAAWLVIALGSLLAESGLGSALVQRSSITERDVEFVLTAQLVVGVMLSVAVAVGAMPLAALLGAPESATALRWLSCVFTIQSVGSVSAAMLKRELRFNQLQISNISSYLVGYLILGVPLALMGAGVASLITAQLVQTTLQSGLTLYFRPVRIRWRSRPENSDIVGFGATVLGTTVLNWVMNNIDTAAISRFFGVVILGLYSRVFGLLSNVVAGLVSTVYQVFLSAFSRSGRTDAELRAAFVPTWCAIILLVAPPYAVVAVIPQLIIEVILGPKWLDATSFVTPVALSMPSFALAYLASAALAARGTPRLELLTQSTLLVILLPALLAASSVSPLAIAWVICVSYTARAASATTMIVVGSRGLLGPLLRAAVPGGVTAVVCALSGAAIDHVMGAAPATLRFAAIALTGAGLYLAAWWFFAPLVFADRSQLPNVVRRFLRRGRPA